MKLKHLRFPCDCMSSSPECADAWAHVAKEGMFKGGTKEEILNLLHRRPRTTAQLAEALGLARPTIHRHISELLMNHLIQEVNPGEKSWSVERYYTPNFPVISGDDQELFREEVALLAEELAEAFRRRLPALQAEFASSKAAASGWDFNEVAYYCWHEAQRTARRTVEAERQLAGGKGERDFPFWAAE